MEVLIAAGRPRVINAAGVLILVEIENGPAQITCGFLGLSRIQMGFNIQVICRNASCHAPRLHFDKIYRLPESLVPFGNLWSVRQTKFSYKSVLCCDSFVLFLHVSKPI